jgi:ligand-binding sensor domain-containing protein
VITSHPISNQRIILLIFTILILGAVSQSVSAQSYSYEVQTIPLKGDFINFNGLSFAQDRDGFIWFGSSEGLYRYEGTSVKVFRHIINDEQSLSNNYVHDLLVDSKGILWIGTNYGLNRFDKYTESFIRYLHDPQDTTSMIPGRIHKIVEDRHKNIWIGTTEGFCRFDRESEVFINYPVTMLGNEAIEPLNQIFSLYPDQEDHLWLFTELCKDLHNSVKDKGA